MTSEEKHIYKLIDLVNAIPNFDWRYLSLSENRNIYLEDIEENKGLDENNPIYPFDADRLSRNPNITLEFVLKYPDLDWDWQELSKNIPISDILSKTELPWSWNDLIVDRKVTDLEFILKLPKSQWNWYILSLYLPASIIFANPEYPWDYVFLSENNTVDMKMVQSHPEIDWNYNKLSEFIDINDIKAHPEVKWNYDFMSINPTLTAEFILQNVNQNWDWRDFFGIKSINFDILADSNLNLTQYLPEFLEFPNGELVRNFTALTSKFIVKYFEYFSSKLEQVQWTLIYRSGIITIDDVITHPELIHNYETFSSSTKLELWYVLAFKDKRWSWIDLSANPSFTVSDIIEGINSTYANWDWHYLSLNPNLTFDFIYDNREKGFSGEILSFNPYNLEYAKQKLVLKLESNYLRKKTIKTSELLNNFIIKDLSNIVTEY